MPGDGKPAGPAGRPAVAMPGSSLVGAGAEALAPIQQISVPTPMLYLAVARRLRRPTPRHPAAPVARREA